MASLQHCLLGTGNPLLDISAEVPASLLDKYGLLPSNAILAEEKHLALYDELIREHQPVKYIAGGATLNSIRAAQWMLQVPNATTYIGCVGRDEYGKRMKQAAQEDGVDVHFMEVDDAKTGTCAVCVVRHERSLVAHLSAAERYKLDHLMQPEQQQLIQRAQFYFVAAFFLTVCPEAVMHIAKHAAEHNKVFSMSLAAPFILEVFGKQVDSLIPYMDYVFANEHEAEALGRVKGWGQDVKTIARNLADMPKVNSARPRVVIFTQGPGPVTVATSGSAKIEEYQAPHVPDEEIVDVNGAGDAFVGGFLAALIHKKDISECLHAATYAAQVVIRRSGCTFPPKPEYSFA